MKYRECFPLLTEFQDPKIYRLHHYDRAIIRKFNLFFQIIIL